MEVIRWAGDIQADCAKVRSGGKSIGFVPTMGFFHEGHLSLIRAARRDRDHLVVSIFVNPLQFGPAEDFASYPRDLERDLALAEKEGADVAFTPEVEEMYPAGPPETTVDPGPLAEILEGARRPGHFRGVCTVLARLFHLIGPSRAFLGEKDAQQLAVVRRMVRDLAFPIEVAGCPTVREPDGLAMSSRNVYLSPEEREAAGCLFEALQDAVETARSGVAQTAPLLAVMRDRVEREPLAELDYAAVVDGASFEQVAELSGPGRALIAARIGRPRLIDNAPLLVGDNEDREVPD